MWTVVLLDWRLGVMIPYRRLSRRVWCCIRPIRLRRRTGWARGRGTADGCPFRSRRPLVGLMGRLLMAMAQRVRRGGMIGMRCRRRDRRRIILLLLLLLLRRIVWAGMKATRRYLR